MKKASELFGIDMALLEQFNDLRLLNATYIRALLIRADYERLTSGLHWLENPEVDYKFPEVMRALCREYNISTRVLKGILHGKKDSLVFCNRCGVRITNACHKRTGGLCSNCFSDNLDL